MSERNGGPAFPIADVRDSNGIGLVEGSPGMSLRDWFAGQALVGLWANAKTESNLVHFALTAYQQADEMLAKRSKR